MSDLITGIVLHLADDLQEALDAGYSLTGDKCVTIVGALKMLGLRAIVVNGKVDIQDLEEGKP